MKLLDVTALAVNHTRNAIAEELYLRGGADFTRPVTVHGIVNEICNYKCRYCECWRQAKYRPEMEIAEWQKAIRDLKAFIGTIHIEFSGVEA